MVDRFITGIIGAPYGVRGYIRLQLFSGETAHIKRLSRIVLRRGQKELLFEVEGTQKAGKAFLIKLKGVDSPEAARLLQGAELIVRREDAAPLRKDEYYIEDLRGLTVYSPTPEGEVVGTIADVVEGGGGQLVEIRCSDGSYKLVPFRNEFFGAIEVEKGFAVLKERWILE